MRTEPEPNFEKLRKFYEDFQCHGVVSFIDYLAHPTNKELLCIGSSTIDFDGVLKNELTEEEAFVAIWFKTYKLHIGSHDGSVTPLQWLEKLSIVFEKISPIARDRFDSVCGSFARMGEAIIAGDFELIEDPNSYFDFREDKNENKSQTIH